MAGPTIYFTDRKTALLGTKILFYITISSFLVNWGIKRFKENSSCWLYTLAKHEIREEKMIFFFNTREGIKRIDNPILGQNIPLNSQYFFIRYYYNNPSQFVIIKDTLPTEHLEYGKIWPSLKKDMYTIEKH